MKIVLPVGKERAWRMIATPDGLASWFPTKCTGHMTPGGLLEFGWKNGKSDVFRILYLGEKHSSFRMRWLDDAMIRFYLHGRMTTLTLEVEYQNNLTGRLDQLSELPQWAFYLANLKSVALGGPDLRNRLKGHGESERFID